MLHIRTKALINMSTDVVKEMSKAGVLFPIKATQTNNTINITYKTTVKQGWMKNAPTIKPPVFCGVGKSDKREI